MSSIITHDELLYKLNKYEKEIQRNTIYLLIKNQYPKNNNISMDLIFRTKYKESVIESCLTWVEKNIENMLKNKMSDVDKNIMYLVNEILINSECLYNKNINDLMSCESINYNYKRNIEEKICVGFIQHKYSRSVGQSCPHKGMYKLSNGNWVCGYHSRNNIELCH